MKKVLYITILACSTLWGSCTEKNKQSARTDSFIEKNVAFARAQIGNEIQIIEKSEKFINPVTLKTDSTIYYCDYADWRSGFFPGSVWYLYELSGDTTLLSLADKYTSAIEEAKKLTWHHDVGFMINCSFGNGWRTTKVPRYKEVMIEAARSLATRFREKPGIIQSWDVTRGWQSERGWECPVIIDNMMNLELLFEATKLSGDSTFYHIAVNHADRTLKEHFRTNGSCYHVIDYSLADGMVRHRQTAQGYADESTWSRGQAWAIYGYTVCYRETHDKKYLNQAFNDHYTAKKTGPEYIGLNQALKTFQFMKTHPRLPKDLIPYWDMDAPNIPNEPRDASSASCIASALYEISTMDVPDANSYKNYADSIMASLASPNYLASLGKNGNFLLMHSVGSIPHGTEIDVPLNYADYYFLEALKRKRDIEEGTH
mgnify:FL=1